MGKFSEDSIYYNAQLDQLYIFDYSSDRLYLLGWGVLWHYVGEL